MPPPNTSGRRARNREMAHFQKAMGIIWAMSHLKPPMPRLCQKERISSMMRHVLWAHAAWGWSTPGNRRRGRKTGHKVIAVVELDRFIPVVLAGIPCNGIVARHTSERHFPFKQAVRQTQGWTVPRAVGGQVKIPLLGEKKTYRGSSPSQNRHARPSPPGRLRKHGWE